MTYISHRLRSLALLLLVYGITMPWACADETGDNLRAVTEHIIPAYQRLAENTARLDRQAERFCRQADAAGFSALRNEYHTGMDAWQSIQHIRFGPVNFLLRYNRFQLWPDKRGSVGKHLARLLASGDKQALDRDTFSHGSVAVQGFSALELLLFEEPVSYQDFSADQDKGRFRCAVLKAITGNLATMAAGVEDQWVNGESAFRNFIATAAEGNDFYDTAADVSSVLLNNFYTELQLIVDQKFDRPLGDSPETARGSRAESWRSGRSLRNIHLNLRSLRDFYHLTFSPRLSDKSLDENIDQAFRAAIQALDKVSLPLEQAVSDATARQQVVSARQAASTLKTLVGTSLPETLGVPLGFNSLDGD